MEDELQSLIAALSDAIHRAVNGCFEPAGIDSSNFEIRCTMRELSSSSQTPLADEVVLFDNHDLFCAFCGRRTYRVAHPEGIGICAACEGARQKREGAQ